MLSSVTKAGTKLTELSVKYGPAWFFVIQVLGTISYWLIFLALISFDLDMNKVALYFKLPTSLASAANTFAGRMAVAFALNRFLSPLRLMLSLFIVPRLADRLNAVLVPFWNRTRAMFGASGHVPVDKSASPTTHAPPPPSIDAIKASIVQETVRLRVNTAKSQARSEM